jgi:hypothetical protein
VELAASHHVDLLHATRPFSLDGGHGRLTGESASASALDLAAVAIKAELSRYPRAFLAASRLRRVLVCHRLRENDQSIPSLPNFHGTLLLDADVRPHELARLLHHELFHFADYADDDQVTRDPAWEKLNDPWFVYGSGGRYMREPGSARLTNSRPGFLTRYATSALEEDKAEVFALLMVAPREVATIAQHDAIVRNKIEAVKRQLVNLSPLLNEHFWASSLAR